MVLFSGGSRRNRPLGFFDNILFTLFLMVFMGAGGFMAVSIGHEVLAGFATRAWRQTECEITDRRVAEIKTRNGKIDHFVVEIIYDYTFDGQKFTSSKYEFKPASFSDYSAAERLVAKYSSGTSAVCYVNPASPAEAVLHPASLFSPLVVLFPLLFFSVGFGGICLLWRPKPLVPAKPKPSNPAAPQRVMILFFSAFFLMGSLGFGLGFVRPAIHIELARQWPEIPCVVISSQVDSHRGKSSTYSVNIFYRYEIDGREYKANRYGFMGGSSSGWAAKDAIVRRYPPGTKAVCYVNPADPTDAVLERGFTSDMWYSLITLIFVVIGAVGLFFTLRRKTV